MKPNDVKLQRTESLLKELIPEAFASLSDERINSVSVTDVVCSRGKYNADVYVYFPFETKEESEKILRLLNKASNRVNSYILAATDWYKCPKLTFKVDESPEKANRIDEIFRKISNDNK